MFGVCCTRRQRKSVYRSVRNFLYSLILKVDNFEKSEALGPSMRETGGRNKFEKAEALGSSMRETGGKKRQRAEKNLRDATKDGSFNLSKLNPSDDMNTANVSDLSNSMDEAGKAGKRGGDFRNSRMREEDGFGIVEED